MFIGALLLFGAGVCANADPLRVEITRVTPATFTQGEPIVLHYAIINNSNQPISVDFGEYGSIGQTDWATQTLTSSDGSVATPLKDSFPYNQGGLHVSSGFIESKGRKEGALVSSRCFSVQHPGKYTLNVQVDLAYIVDQSDHMVFASKATPATKFKEIFHFPLVVTAPDIHLMENMATKLELNAEQAKDHDQQMLLIQELATLPEDQAWPSWVKLAKNAFLGYSLALELGRRPTTRTADVMSQVIWPADASAKSSSGYELGNQFYGMYSHSSGLLKTHIRQIYADHGVDVDAPGQVFVVQVTD